MRVVASVLALATTGLAACGDDPAPKAALPTAPAPAGPAWFVDEAAERGLVFTWRSGHAGKHYFPEIMGGGAALLDVEGDGDLDAYLVQAGSILARPEERPANQLFENRGGRFADVSAASGTDDRGYGMGVATGDADGDGRTDLYVTNVGPNVLYANRGDGSFADRTTTSGTGDPSWSTSAAFFDPDRDGDLDLYVVNYVAWSVEGERVCYTQPHPEDYCSPNSYGAPAPDTLYCNEGDGTFRDVSFQAGVRAALGNGLGVVCGDFDGDGWSDVFVANDGSLNLLWQNRGDGTFADRAMPAGVAVDQEGRKKAGMGTHAVDVDHDGDEDLLVVNLAGEGDSFYRNDGTHFSDRTPLVGLAGVSRSFTRFGVGFADFDQDGWLDLYQSNGRVTRRPEATSAAAFDEANLVFRGRADGRFEEVLPRGGTAELLVDTSRAAAFGDVDGDGALDVLVVNRDAPAYLLMNRVSARGGWVAFAVREANGRDALGAVLAGELGARPLVRSVRSAYSYCAASDARVHVGLGAASELGPVTVTFGDGTRERFAGPFAAGSVHELRRGTGAALPGR
jgi:hypothetical protein